MYKRGEGIAQDHREAYIWYSMAGEDSDGLTVADNLRESKWNLTTAEIKSARREAARRLEEIDQLIK